MSCNSPSLLVFKMNFATSGDVFSEPAFLLQDVQAVPAGGGLRRWCDRPPCHPVPQVLQPRRRGDPPKTSEQAGKGRQVAQKEAHYMKRRSTTGILL